MRIIVLTCDKYTWILPIFFHFFNKYWKDCPYPVDVITENHLSKDLGKEGTLFHTFYTHGIPWSDGIIEYLKKAKDNKFILLPEDYIIRSLVDTEKIKEAEKLCSKDVGCVRLNEPDKYYHKFALDSGIQGHPVIKKYPLSKPYSMSMQAAIWQKQYLLDVLRYGEDAWQAEIIGSKRLAKMGDKWKVLWPKSSAMDYEAGGLMVKGRARVEVMKWIFNELLKEVES